MEIANIKESINNLTGSDLGEFKSESELELGDLEKRFYNKKEYEYFVSFIYHYIIYIYIYIYKYIYIIYFIFIHQQIYFLKEIIQISMK